MAESALAVEQLREGAATAGGRDAAAMWAEFGTRLRGFVARRVPAGVDPEDVVQEIFLRVVRHLPSVRDNERIEAWLFQIARNAVQDALRRRHRRDSRTDPLEVDPAAEAEDGQVAEAELAPCLTPMIARLPEPYRTAIELTVLQGVSQPEAAARAGISVSGMKRACSARASGCGRHSSSVAPSRWIAAAESPTTTSGTSPRAAAGSTPPARGAAAPRGAPRHVRDFLTASHRPPPAAHHASSECVRPDARASPEVRRPRTACRHSTRRPHAGPDPH